MHYGSVSYTHLEPGSTFKTVTAAAALEAGVVTFKDTFSCPGFYIVEDRRIRCHKVSGHGSETFLQGIQNSCNPVFIQVGLRLGAERFYSYFEDVYKRQVTNGTVYGVQVADKENGVKMDGYDFGGKTGTAQKLPRSEDKYVISLISAAPMSSPQLVLYVVVDEYEGNDEDGSAPRCV